MNDIRLYMRLNHNKYMLYGKEISYFTVFKIIEPQYFEKLLLCLNVGPLKLWI